MGAIEGAAMGFLDPTEGIATTMFISGVIGGASNITGQMISNISHGRLYSDINVGAVIGSILGSAIGGGMGQVATNMALSMGAPPALASLVSSIGMAPSALGGNIGEAFCK